MSDLVKEIAGDLIRFGGLEPDALASIVNEDGSVDADKLKALREKASEGIQSKLKAKDEEAAQKATEAFDRKRRELEAKLLTDREKRLKERIKIDKDVRGEELDNLIADLLSKGAKGSDLDEAAIERSPRFQSERERLLKEKQDALAAKDAEVEKLKGEFTRKWTNREVWDLAQPKIKSLNPNFSEDAGIAANQLGIIKEKLFSSLYDLQEGRVLVLAEDGSVKKDSLGNPVDFDGQIAEIVKAYIGVKAAEKRDGAGVRNTPGAVEAGTPATMEDLMKIVNDPKISTAEKRKAKEAFERKRAAA